MKLIAILLVVSSFSTCRNSPTVPLPSAAKKRIDLPLEDRLDLPQPVAGSSLRLKEFVCFLATAFKVPFLLETPNPSADVSLPSGTLTARQLLDSLTAQLPGYEWRDEQGVAHVYEKQLVRSRGNVLNVVIPRFSFPHSVGEFMYYFRPCVHSVIQGYDCGGGIYMGFQLPKLKQGQLPYLQTFSNQPARDIILAALRENGRFYVRIESESTDPKSNSEYALTHWFAESLEDDESLC